MTLQHPRKFLGNQPLALEFSAGIVIYQKTDEGPKFLLLYHGGRYWNFPKGKLEKAEDSYGAALREVREETGLTRNDLKFDNRFKVRETFVFMRNKRKTLKTVVYFLAETKNPNIKLSDEHDGYGWFVYREAVRMAIYQNLRNNLKKANDLVRGKSLESGPKNSKR